jgi:hypothetical protein
MVAGVAVGTGLLTIEVVAGKRRGLPPAQGSSRVCTGCKPNRTLFFYVLGSSAARVTPHGREGQMECGALLFQKGARVENMLLCHSACGFRVPSSVHRFECTFCQRHGAALTWLYDVRVTRIDLLGTRPDLRHCPAAPVTQRVQPRTAACTRTALASHPLLHTHVRSLLATGTSHKHGRICSAPRS